MIDQLGKAKFITTLNLTRGYWQVPVASSDRHKTAFITPFRLYQFTKMPFGLQGAPATFQGMMDQLIQGLQEFASVYPDDLVIYSNSWEDHLLHIRQVLQRLQHAGLTAKPNKCLFGMEQCSYLGYIVIEWCYLNSIKWKRYSRLLLPRRRRMFEHSSVLQAITTDLFKIL